MARASTDFFSLHGTLPSQTVTADVAVDRWLEQLLKHFSIQQLDTISTQEIAAYLTDCLDSTDSLDTETATYTSQTDAQTSTQINTTRSHLSKSSNRHTSNRHTLAIELKRRVMRLAGVKLDNAFLSMASHVVDEAMVKAVSLSVEGQQLHGVRYRGDVYRQVDSFKLCHQLQAYCLAQTLSEQNVQYLITRSAHKFIVWANIRTFPKQNSSAIC